MPDVTDSTVTPKLLQVWGYSLYAGAIVILFYIFFWLPRTFLVYPAEAKHFHILFPIYAILGAIVVARISGAFATLIGGSEDGLLALVFIILLYSVVLTLGRYASELFYDDCLTPYFDMHISCGKPTLAALSRKFPESAVLTGIFIVTPISLISAVVYKFLKPGLKKLAL